MRGMITFSRRGKRGSNSEASEGSAGKYVKKKCKTAR